MQTIQFWSLLVCLSCATIDVSNAVNPKINYVELTDNSTHAGTRKSRATLLCVEKKDDTGNHQDISLNAVADVTNDDGTQPTWNASKGSITGAGSSATWSGKEAANISASLSGASSSANISIVPLNERPITLLDKDKSTVKETIDDFNSLISKLGYKTGLAVSGSCDIKISNTDFYNEGSKTGLKVEASGEVTASIGTLSVDIEIPTTVPSVKAIGRASLNLQKVSAKITGTFDESKPNPMALSGQLGWEAGVSATAGVAIGVPAGSNIIEFTVSGSTSVKITGDITGEGRNIVIDGKVEANALEAKATIKWVLGVDSTLAEGTKNFGEPVNRPLGKKVIYTLPNSA